MKVPVQMVLLSLAWLELIELLSDPLALTLPLSLMTEISAVEKLVPEKPDSVLVHPLELPQTGSEKTSVTVAVSLVLISISSIVKLSAQGRMVSTL